MFTQEELPIQLGKKDSFARKQAFYEYSGKLAGISQRYCKSTAQAQEALIQCFSGCLDVLHHQKQPKNQDLATFFEQEFIKQCIGFIKNIRNEYYVSSTVHASETTQNTYNLFENNEWIDFNNVETDILIGALQQLVPSQRLIFNLHVIDGFTLPDAAAILESSEATVKSNLEKARYNLQKNIEKKLRSLKP